MIFSIFMLFFPQNSKDGAIDGIKLCVNVIIPSLFPFTFCVLFIKNFNLLEKLYFLEKITLFLFGLSSEEFSIMILSFIGGYPTGAKLIDDYQNENSVPQIKCNLMLCYCINAGPAFIVMAVGVGILNSKKLGWLLLLAHIIASLILAVVLRPLSKKQAVETKHKNTNINIHKNFVLSVKSAASSTFSVCIYIILFAVIKVFFEHINLYLPFLKSITCLFEVTTAVLESNNLYHIAFLLGFSGICVWCQILGLVKNFNINLPYFITARVIHGILSAFIMFLLLRIFKISIPTFSNAVNIKSDFIYRSVPLSVSLIILGVFFIIATLPEDFTKSKHKKMLVKPT